MIQIFLIFFSICTSGKVHADEQIKYFHVEENKINLGIITQKELDKMMEKNFLFIGDTKKIVLRPTRYKVNRYRSMSHNISYETNLIFELEKDVSYFLAFELVSTLKESEITTGDFASTEVDISKIFKLLDTEPEELTSLKKKIRFYSDNYEYKDHHTNFIKVFNTTPKTFVIQTGYSPLVFNKDKVFFEYEEEGDEYKSGVFKTIITLKNRLYLYLNTSDMGPDTQPLLIKMNPEASDNFELIPYPGKYGHRGC